MRESNLIVLLTDFGIKDAYVASMKGVILSLHPGARIVDLSHDVEPQNLIQAAFLLRAAYPYFPHGSIFVTVVDPGVGSSRQILAAKTSHGIFLAPDNGILGQVLGQEGHCELRAVTHKKFFLKKVSSTFQGRDCFAPTAAHLAKDASQFSEVGPLAKERVHLEFPHPEKQRRKIIGQVIFVDRFGNAFTNISRSLLEGKGEAAGWRVYVKGEAKLPLRKSYCEVGRGEAVAVFSSTDLLEIAVNQGSAAQKLGLQAGDPVEIKKS